MQPDFIHAPSKLLFAMEFARGTIEYLHGWAGKQSVAQRCARGTAPVMVYPGMATNDAATAMLREFLESLGYAVYGWGRGVNRGPNGDFDAFLGELCDDLRTIRDHHGQRVHVIGWSLGGVYAREVAKMQPDLVAQAITLGTPFSGAAESTNAGLVFELISQTQCHRDPRLLRRIAVTPKVPTVSVYSKSDGVVAWQSSLNPARRGAENVEVHCSHLGLISSPQVMEVLASRLAAPKAVNVVEVEFGRGALRKAA